MELSNNDSSSPTTGYWHGYVQLHKEATSHNLNMARTVVPRLPPPLPPLPPFFSSAAGASMPGSPAVEKTDPHDNLSLQLPPPDGHTSRGVPTIHPTDGQTSEPRTFRDTWDPIKRYRSGRSSLPDYGSPQESTMSRSKKIAAYLGQVQYGNFLDSGGSASTRPDQQALPPKRPSENSLARQVKRPRNDDNGEPEVVSLDCSSETTQRQRPSRSPVQHRNSGRRSHSVQSSGERETRGTMISEYRTTSKQIPAGSKRARHKKDPTKMPRQDVSQKKGGDANPQRTNPAPPIKRRLVSTYKVQLDDIEDEADLIPEKQPGGDNKRTPPRPSRGLSYHASRFVMPQIVDSEDDEDEGDAIAHLPPLRRRDLAAGKSGTHQLHHTNGVKRMPNDPDELQSSHSIERRPQPSDGADVPKTKFLSAATARTREGLGLCVQGAVCYPTYIYPDTDANPGNTRGASDEPCYLVQLEGSPSAFEARDSRGRILKELGWILPKVSTISRILYNHALPFVKIWKRSDSTSSFSTGAVLILTFGTSQEATTYVNVCKGANSAIELANTYDKNLIDTVESTTKHIRERKWTNRRHSPAHTPVLERKQATTNPSTRFDYSPKPLHTSTSDHYAQTKALRSRMRADVGSEVGAPAAETTSTDFTPKTPTEERMLQKLMASSDGGDDSQDEEWRSMRRRQSPAQSSGREVVAQSQRKLRSSRAKTRSPSPPPLRWTEQNPNWEDERGYKIPLSYERTTINATDIERLDEGQFLNDEIISFYAKYLHKQLEARDAQMAKRVYIFNSFFWEKLKVKGYNGVKTWTAKIDLLSFDYIIVPINQNAHWYLAIVCNPGGLLTPEDNDPDEQEIAVPMDVDTDAEPNPAAVKSDFDHASIAGQVDKPTMSDVEDPGKVQNGKKFKASKKGPGPRKYDPKDPRVITLDSLDGSHSGVSTALKHYLKDEIKHRKGVDIVVPSVFGMTPRDIPFQNNFTDCGVYLLGYLEEFMKDPREFTRRILQHEARDWNVNAPALRNKIRDLIFKLQRTYQQDEIQRRRERKLLADRRQTRSQNPAAEAKSDPTIASEQPRGAVSASASSRSDKGAWSGPDVASQQTSVTEEQRMPGMGSEQAPQRSSASASSVKNSRHQTPSSHAKSRLDPVRRDHADEELLQQRARTSVSPPPLERPRGSSGQRQDSEHTDRDVSISMIVNPNDSVEITDQQSLPQQRPGPHVTKSVEDANENAPQKHAAQKLHSVQPSAPPETPQKPERSLRTYGRYSESRLMLPMHSSSPPKAGSSASGGQKKTWSNTDTTKFATREQEETRSRFFASSSVKPSGANRRTRANPTPEYTAVLSSPEEEKRIASGSAFKNAIDLTND